MPVTGVRPAESPYDVWPCEAGVDVRVLRHVCGVVVANEPISQSWREREKHHCRQKDADGCPAASDTRERLGRSRYFSQDVMLAGVIPAGNFTAQKAPSLVSQTAIFRFTMQYWHKNPNKYR